MRHMNRVTVALAVTMLLVGSAASIAEPLADSGERIKAEPAVRAVTLNGVRTSGETLRAEGTGLVIGRGEESSRIEFADLLEVTLKAPPERRREPNAFSIEVELSNGDLVRGRLVSGQDETGFVISSAALGKVSISLDLVLRVRFLRNLERFEDPVTLAAGEKTDQFLFTSGDRLEGTMRSLGTDGVRVRTDTGRNRLLKLDDLLGFALVPFDPEKEEGVRVRVDLRGGSRLSGTALQSSADGKSMTLKGTLDGRDRAIPFAAVAAITARGGRGVILSDLTPTRVDVKPYWGDDPIVLHHKPRFDRAFSLEAGAPPPLRIGGRTFSRGVSVFSGTTLTYDLAEGGFTRFTTAVAVDDGGPKGAVEFEILVDGKSAWRSGIVTAVEPGAGAMEVPAVDLTGKKILQLRVHAGPGDDVHDYADWVDAALLR